MHSSSKDYCGYSVHSIRRNQLKYELIDRIASCVQGARPLYASSSIGREKESKPSELTAPPPQFIATNIHGVNAGFVSYLYDVQEHEVVLYVYKLYVPIIRAEMGCFLHS